jgi:hypothetical protein
MGLLKLFKKSKKDKTNSSNNYAESDVRPSSPSPLPSLQVSPTPPKQHTATSNDSTLTSSTYSNTTKVNTPTPPNPDFTATSSSSSSSFNALNNIFQMLKKPLSKSSLKTSTSAMPTSTSTPTSPLAPPQQQQQQQQKSQKKQHQILDDVKAFIDFKDGDFNDEYNKGKKLGEGTFGAVYECVKKNGGGNEVKLAVKIMSKVGTIRLVV